MLPSILYQAYTENRLLGFEIGGEYTNMVGISPIS
jgi:hypothetical protein